MTIQFCETLVWVLVHSLWQGVIIAGCVSMLLRGLPARRAEVRYSVGLAGLGLVVLCTLVTWSVLTLEPTSFPVLAGAGPTATAHALTAHSPLTAEAHQVLADQPIPRTAATANISYPDPRTDAAGTAHAWIAWVAALWFIGASVMLIRSVVAVVQVRRWRSMSTFDAVPALDQLQAVMQELCGRMRLKRLISMVVSDQVDVPSVIGTLWPCILLPPALVTGIPLDQWRVILAHELAHIRRYDVLVNLVQMMIESLLFFNPAVWWISHQIRVEREACCDALAARICGQPLSVARTLVEFAAGLQDVARRPDSAARLTISNAGQPSSKAVMAFADSAEPGELTDRVQRLVAPDLAARPRVSWLALGVVVCALLLSGLALYWGTTLAVQTAANLMSPQERVSKLERLQSEATGVFLTPEPATSSAVPDKFPNGTNSEPQNTQIEVTLVVRTADGTPVPKGTRLEAHRQSGNSTGGSSLGEIKEATPEYRQVVRYNPSRIRIGASAQGFAAVSTPIISLFPGDQPKTVELILTRGTATQLKIHDPQGQPIAHVEGRLSGLLTIAGGTVGLDTQEFTSDADGIVNLEHVGDLPYDVRIRKPGFQRYDARIEFKPGQVVDTKMNVAVPVKYQVLDAVTGQPVANARFVIALQKRPGHTYMFSDPRNILTTDRGLNYAVTDEHGQAAIDELNSGAQYAFGVVAAGYGMVVLEDVVSGQAPGTVKLAAPLKLSGRIDGPLDLLTKASRNGVEPPSRALSYTSRINDYITHSDWTAVADDGRFEIDNLVQNETVTIQLGDLRRDFVMAGSLADVVLKSVSTDPVAFPKREVIIRLTGTAPQAPARGNLYVRYQHPDPACRDSQNGPLPLQGNEIRLQVPIGASVSFEPRNLVAYRIENRDAIAVSAGNGPQVIEVPTQPAGGIHGTVLHADGTPAIGAQISIFATQLPPGEKDQSRLNANSGAASSTYLVTVPLGGRYRILAREMNDSHSVWTVSDEVAITGSQPIVEVNLKLPVGHTVPIKVLDPLGKPVVGQTVQLSLEFVLGRSHSFGTSVSRTTGADGIARFEDVSFDALVSPLKCNLRAEVANPKYIGWQNEINASRPVEIHLEQGRTATGVVIDATSGKPIPKAMVRLVPRDFSLAKYKAAVNTTTDAQGEFRYDGLEPMEYTGYVEQTSPKGTILTPYPQGGLRMSYPAGVEQHKLDASVRNFTRWEVIIHPGSKLHPTP